MDARVDQGDLNAEGSGRVLISSSEARRGKGGIVRSTPRAAIEPLLQHYGLRTRWIDVVDNVWVALWFACHDQITHKEGRYAHHARRSTAQERDGYAHVSVLDLGERELTPVQGLYRAVHARVADLRSAVPSIYLRPHAQHGLVVAGQRWDAAEEQDLSHLCEVTLCIALGDALEWLGQGQMISPYSLFPPPTRDEGFRRLLDYAPEPPAPLGVFPVYGPGV